MAERMPAYRLLEWERPPALTDAPVPAPGPGEVRVRVAANGLCHSDIAMAQMPGAVGDELGWRVPFTLGHEVAGHVDALGDGVEGFAVGDAVALLSPSSCGTCALCRAGRESACPSGLVGRGYGRDGGLAPYVVAPAAREVLPIGDLDPALAAPLTDAGATSHHAVARVIERLADDATVAVIGIGGLGAFVVQLLRALSPARVVAVDINEPRRQLALELGAHEVFHDVRDAGSVDAVIDIVGTDDTISRGLRAVNPYGAFALVGAAGGSFARPWFNGLPRDAEIFTFQGSNIAEAVAVLELARTGSVRSLVERFPLGAVADAYAALDAGELRGRAVVVP